MNWQSVYELQCSVFPAFQCGLCDQVHTIQLNEFQFARYMKGLVLAVDAFHDLHPELLMMIVTGVCPECQGKMNKAGLVAILV